MGRARRLYRACPKVPKRLGPLHSCYLPFWHPFGKWDSKGKNWVYLRNGEVDGNSSVNPLRYNSQGDPHCSLFVDQGNQLLDSKEVLVAGKQLHFPLLGWSLSIAGRRVSVLQFHSETGYRRGGVTIEEIKKSFGKLITLVYSTRKAQEQERQLTERMQKTLSDRIGPPVFDQAGSAEKVFQLPWLTDLTVPSRR